LRFDLFISLGVYIIVLQLKKIAANTVTSSNF